MANLRCVGLIGPAVMAVAVSCSVGDLDLTGKACPCAEDYICDTASNVCVYKTSSPDVDAGTAAPDAAPDVTLDVTTEATADAGVPTPLVVVSAFKAVWQTANAVRWTWKATGDAASFAAYAITWADTLAKLESGAGVTLVGSAQKPELGAFDARGGNTTGTVDVWTTTYAHPPATPIFAKLTALDIRGTTSTMIASASTTTPHTARVLFDGTNMLTAQPPTFEFRAPAGEEPHYFFETDCGVSVGSCARHIELDGIARDLATPTFTAADFANAFLHVRLAGDIASSGFTSAIAIEPANCTQGRDYCQWRFDGWSLRDSGPILQVPLRELANAHGKLTYQNLSAAGFVIAAFAISGTWKDQSWVRLYDARIRW